MEKAVCFFETQNLRQRSRRSKVTIAFKSSALLAPPQLAIAFFQAAFFASQSKCSAVWSRPPWRVLSLL
jgi:hypothetical protein